MALALYVFIILIGLLLTQEIFRRFPKFTLAVFAILPIIMTPYWIGNGIKDWFFWAKVFSVAAIVVWFSIFKLTNINKNKLSKIAIWLLLSINIFEAVTKDALSGGTAHYFNAIAGILLIVTLNKIDSISISKDKYMDVNWNGMTLMWIIGNTIWDWTFVYLNFPQFSAQHLAVLGAPLIVVFFSKGRWLQARAVTLSAYLIVLYSLHKIDPNAYSNWANKTIGYALAEVSLIFMIIYTIIFLRSSDLRRNNPQKG